MMSIAKRPTADTDKNENRFLSISKSSVSRKYAGFDLGLLLVYFACFRVRRFFSSPVIEFTTSTVSAPLLFFFDLQEMGR